MDRLNAREYFLNKRKCCSKTQNEYIKIKHNFEPFIMATDVALEDIRRIKEILCSRCVYTLYKAYIYISKFTRY